MHINTYIDTYARHTVLTHARKRARARAHTHTHTHTHTRSQVEGKPVTLGLWDTAGQVFLIINNIS